MELPRGGKAAALNAGIERATGEILFMTDVRQALDPQCLRYLTACLSESGRGQRRTGDPEEGENQEQANVGLYWKLEKWFRKRMSAIDSFHGATGAIYAIRRRLVSPMPAGTLLDDVYLPLLAFFQGYRVIFEPRAVAYDDPTPLDTEFSPEGPNAGRRLPAPALLPGLLGPRNRMWIHFVSHKLGRLLLPFALIALAVSAFWLPGRFSAVAVIAQAGFYGLALCDRFVPDRTVFKKVTSMAWTFTVLMAAALCAVEILFRPGRTLWKPNPGSL